jgi:hypothetical protein
MLTLITGEKLIVREDTAEIMERVLAYRTRLLVLVAKRLPSYGELQRAASLLSLDLSEKPKPVSDAPARGPLDDQ